MSILLQLGSNSGNAVCVIEHMILSNRIIVNMSNNDTVEDQKAN